MEDGVAGVTVQKGGDTMELAVDGLSRSQFTLSFTLFLQKDKTTW
jgi:hypothetical protein